MFLHLQSSLENKEYEAAANFVDTLAKLHNFMPNKDDSTASDSENAHFVRVRDAVARVVREELHTAASKGDVSQVRTRHASSSAVSVLASLPRNSLCENCCQTSQVLRYAKLFPKLCLSDEGLSTVCLQLRKVRRKPEFLCICVLGVDLPPLVFCYSLSLHISNKVKGGGAPRT